MMNTMQLSKTLSYWLRHNPSAANLKLTDQGWVNVGAVLAALCQTGTQIDRQQLDDIVTHNTKQRFEFSDNGTLIRARQGHSVQVTLDWPQREPPSLLYHGTVEHFIEDILKMGLRPMRRHHVHLSADIATAQIVGKRRGNPVILKIEATKMAASGSVFMLTSNDVWLTDAVAPHYIEILL